MALSHGLTTRLIWPAIALTLIVLVAACSGGDKPARQPEAAAPVPSPTAAQSAEDAPIVLVALQGYPVDRAERIARRLSDKHGIQIAVAAPIELPESVIDPERRQVVAERMLDVIARSPAGADSTRVVIGLTDYDMTIAEKPEWAFAFSFRDEVRGFAVISTTRMDPQTFGMRKDEDLLIERTSKMVAKSIGVMYLGLPLSTDPRSLMYDSIFSVDALDTVGDEFLP